MEALTGRLYGSGFWPSLENVDLIHSTFPSSVDALEAYSEKAVLEIEALFRKVIAVPCAVKNFDNTFFAIDLALAKTHSHSRILQVVAYTHTVSKVRVKALECLRRLQSVAIKYSSDRELYEACLCANLNCRDQREKDIAMKERLHAFKIEGAHLNREEWAYCLDLKKEIKNLETDFLKNLDEDNTSLWVLKSELEGVSNKLIDAFEKKGDFCRVPCDTNSYYGIMCFCEIEKTRKRVFLAYNKRAHQKNLPILKALIIKRRELANLLNFQSYAHLDLFKELAKSPEEAERFLSRLEEALKPIAEVELTGLQKRIFENSFREGVKILPWNMPYISALGRGYACQEDDLELCQYFSLDEAFPKLLDYLASIFQLRLHLKNEKIWEGVNFLVEVRDENNLLLGNIAYDLYPRAGKYGHALCIDAVPPIILNEVKMPALAVVITNISHPNQQNRTLLTLDELSTLLHETGHALHAVLGASAMPLKAGYRTPTDFLEMPPILLENLIYEEDFLRFIGRHHLTQEPLKEAFLKARKSSRKFGLSYILLGQIALSKLSLDLFWRSKGSDTASIREEIYRSVQPLIAPIENHHFEATFRHLADPLYGAKYYGFLYALAYSHQINNKIQENPKREWFRFRKIVLERGGEGNPLDHLRIFLNQEPSIDGFLRFVS